MKRLFHWLNTPVAVPRWENVAFLSLITLGAVATFLELLANALT